MKKTVFNLIHLLSYIISIFIIIVLLITISSSLSGYSSSIINSSYVNLDVKILINFYDNKVELITIDDNYSYFYKVKDGIVYFNNSEYIIFSNGLFNPEENVYFLKLNEQINFD